MQPKNATSLTYSLADCEGVVDVFKGRKIWWDLITIERKRSPSLSWDPPPQTSRFLNMRVHRRDRAMVMSEYLPYVLDNAKALKAKRRERKLYTNSSRDEWFSIRNKVWDSIPFKHPATFGTLALDPLLKQRIMDDLLDFKNGEQFYKDAGRAWKRGYLLYGPPGTGKSSMIASIANFLEYDVYDLELGEVKSNVNLKGLLLEISDKALVVIEDIDCSLDLSRMKKKDEEKESDSMKPPWAEKEDKPSKVTLSGVLNLIDGLWSSCGNERIFVFTTNHIEKLDEALIRSGRMDMHIHLSFCGFEAVKLLAKNYLKLENHFLFEEVQAVMQEDGVCMTPSDVTEVFTRERRDPEQALKSLIEELRQSKTKKKVQEMSEQKIREAKELLTEEKGVNHEIEVPGAITEASDNMQKNSSAGLTMLDGTHPKEQPEKEELNDLDNEDEGAEGSR
ncbi:hypothetical protein KP509_37G021100 [Ceratopteris richardii]|uniref:AAA+ ATPase domain-containing protein n=1 Tax=Ceratopteris richardii TaxID=49495 RepID=A0A8T2Q762_CERRI|nr:hypothetical protein KP509_37G021100 [Ceratopteris richardii]